MNSVNGVNTGVNKLNPAEMSQQDFIAAVYLERGEMLDTEVRRLVGVVDKSNQMANAINTLLGKNNVTQFGTTVYSEPTWSVNGNTVVLDNGYGLKMSPDGQGGTSFVLLDADGNQLMYQNQTLLPIPKGTAVDALKSGIPVMSNMTLVLDDGTEITFGVDSDGGEMNPVDLSGGLKNISTIAISRGNQILNITDFDSLSPNVPQPALTSDASLDTYVNDGHVLMEAGGVHSWEYDGQLVGNMTRKHSESASEEVSGYFARKIAFKDELVNDFISENPVLTAREIDLLKNELRITYSDASGTGRLTPEEWSALKSSLVAARDNLTSNTQLQTAQLQRAMQSYTHNYDAMSNAQSKVYNLLKDIVSNIK
ncbi:MAG: hypothetical protein ACPG5T_06545 [Endozoicomonas sp.]